MSSRSVSFDEKFETHSVVQQVPAAQQEDQSVDQQHVDLFGQDYFYPDPTTPQGSDLDHGEHGTPPPEPQQLQGDEDFRDYTFETPTAQDNTVADDEARDYYYPSSGESPGNGSVMFGHQFLNPLRSHPSLYSRIATLTVSLVSVIMYLLMWHHL